MRSKRSGLIVNISSMRGLIALPFQGFDCASKYALEALTEALRMEVKPYGVQVTLILTRELSVDHEKKVFILSILAEQDGAQATCSI